MEQRSFWDKFWRDKNGDTVVVHKPNLPLMVFIVAAVLYAIFQYSKAGKVFGWISFAALIIWALWELLAGVNYFRRLLGLAVLLLGIAFSIF